MKKDKILNTVKSMMVLVLVMALSLNTFVNVFASTDDPSLRDSVSENIESNPSVGDEIQDKDETTSQEDDKEPEVSETVGSDPSQDASEDPQMVDSLSDGKTRDVTNTEVNEITNGEEQTEREGINRAENVEKTSRSIIQNVSELETALLNASDGDVLTLSYSFVSGNIEITMPDIKITIEGNGVNWNQGILKIKGSGMGTLNIKNITMNNNIQSQTLIQLSNTHGVVNFDGLVMSNAKNGSLHIATGNNAQTHISNASFDNNFATNGASVIYLGSSANVTLEYATLSNNATTGGGYECGAIASKGYKGVLEINNTIFDNNRNGCLNTGLVGGGGGAIAIHYFEGDVTINDSYFYKNQTNGEGVSVANTYDGGAIYVMDGRNDATFTVNRSLFEENIAYDDGGAILLQGTGNPGLITNINDSIFVNNYAYGLDGANFSGGAIQYFKNGGSSRFTNTITGSTFIGNTSGNEASQMDQRGGAIGLSGSTFGAAVTRKSSLFIGNNVYGADGAINVASNYKDISNSTVTQLDTNFINADKGSTPQFTMKDVLGNDSLRMNTNYSAIRVGVDRELMKTLQLRPEGVAENKSSTNLSGTDYLNNPRFKDIGATEISWIKYNANGGQFNLQPLPYYEGVRFYLADDAGVVSDYYSVGYIGLNDAIESHTTLALEREGYTFEGWSEDPLATQGDARYESGSAVVHHGEDLILYAVWKEIPETYTLRYDGNGNTSGEVPVDETAYELNQDARVLPEGNLKKDGYTFVGWNTQVDGLGDMYLVGSSMKITGNMVLYAQWEIIPETYSLRYDGNGNTSGEVPVDETAYELNQDARVLPEGNLKKDGYTFVGWNTQVDGLGDMYLAGSSLTITDNTVLYAIWNRVPITYTLHYDGNGNTSGISPVDLNHYEYGTKAKLMGQNTLLRDGFIFVGWNTQADGQGVSYQVNDAITMDANKTLYAQWEMIMTPEKPTKPQPPVSPHLPSTGVGSNIEVALILLLSGFIMIAFSKVFKKKEN